jgi:hypothetical protein
VGFLVEPQNQGGRFVSGLASKPVATIFADLTSKSVVTVSPGLALKPVVGFLLEPQTKVVEGFPVWTSKPVATSLVIWASKSPRRFLGLSLKTNQTSVYRLHHKTDGGRLVRDTRRDLAAYLAWKQV